MLLQAVLYFKVYARDDSRLKALVRVQSSGCSTCYLLGVRRKVVGVWYGFLLHFPLADAKHNSRILDSIHTGLIWASLWDYLIENFGDQEFIESIPL